MGVKRGRGGEGGGGEVPGAHVRFASEGSGDGAPHGGPGVEQAVGVVVERLAASRAGGTHRGANVSHAHRCRGNKRERARCARAGPMLGPGSGG